MQPTNKTHCCWNAAESNPLSKTTTLLPFVTQVLKYEATTEKNFYNNLLYKNQTSKSLPYLIYLLILKVSDKNKQKPYTADDAPMVKSSKLTFNTCFLYKRKRGENQIAGSQLAQ